MAVPPPAGGLPPVISGHNQYFLWGPRGYSGDVVIDVGGDCAAREGLFASAERAVTFTARWIQPYEDNLPIMVPSHAMSTAASLRTSISFGTRSCSVGAGSSEDVGLPLGDASRPLRLVTGADTPEHPRLRARLRPLSPRRRDHRCSG